MSEKLIIEEPGKFKIIFYDNNSEIIFITFNEIFGSFDSEPFGKKFLFKNGYSVICCFQEKDTQYQHLSFDIFKSHVEKIVENKKVFLYGSSLGGYCAIYYSAAVNGTVISASPRITQHPKLVDEFKDKIEKDFFKHGEFKRNSKEDKKIFIFYDSTQKRDVFFINEIIKKQINNEMLNIFDFPHVGHDKVLRHLLVREDLEHIIKSIVNNDFERAFKYLKNEKDSIYSCFGKAMHALDDAVINLKKIDENSRKKSIKNIKTIQKKLSIIDSLTFKENHQKIEMEIMSKNKKIEDGNMFVGKEKLNLKEKIMKYFY